MPGRLPDPAVVPLVEMRDITKRFPGVVANDNVSFDVRAGEVHTLFGENGAGKSTLMRVLYGLYRPDEGEIRINGQPVAISSPSNAIHNGIGMIHQHFMLVDTLTVAENVALGSKTTRGPGNDLEHVSARIHELADRYGLSVDPGALIWQLSVGERQRVEIIKALYRDVALLILDEPTAVLAPQEVADLFAVLRQMTKDGRGLVFISHKVSEVLELSDRITVLRNGKVVGTVPVAEASRSVLVEMMVGHQLATVAHQAKGVAGSERLVVTDLRVRGDRDTEVVRGCSFTVGSGEVVGIAGVAGNGQRELAEAIAGLRARFGFLRTRAIRRHCQELVAAFDVKTPTLDTPARSLSGGNIQKLIMARELSGRPQVLLVAQPTRGIDVSASRYIHERLIAQRDSGTAVVIISYDLDEILALSDRVLVMYEGAIIGSADPRTASREEIGMMMAGIRPETQAAASGTPGLAMAAQEGVTTP
jgi:ABC-type uncharacterized transport system ATPase subunit